MDKRAKILFLLHFPPPVHGSSIIGLSIKESVLINSEFNCSYINLLTSKNVADSGIVNLIKIWNFALIWINVILIILRKRPKLCYLAMSTTGTAFFKDVLIIALLKIFRIKLVYHMHNKGINRYQKNTLYKNCYRYVFNSSDVILLSEYLYSDIRDFIPRSKIHICPNGISDEAIEFSDTSDKKDKQIESFKSNIFNNNQKGSIKNIQILFLSNLIESKGVFILLDACNLLKKKEIKFECILVGAEGNISTSQLNKRICQLGLVEEVYYHSKKQGAEKLKIFSEADIFVIPTFEDCFPLVILEAMSNSLPVVSTFEGGIRDIVENNITGFLVIQKDVESLADKLEILIRNPELRQEMGKSGRKRFEENFTRVIFENRLTEILSKIVKENAHII